MIKEQLRKEKREDICRTWSRELKIENDLRKKEVTENTV